MFIVLVNAGEFRTLMHQASQLGMASGDYVFIAIQLAEIDWWGSYRNFLKGEINCCISVASHSDLSLTLLEPVRSANVIGTQCFIPHILEIISGHFTHNNATAFDSRTRKYVKWYGVRQL